MKPIVRKKLVAAINKLKVSKAVKKILIDIATQCEGAWIDSVKLLQKENRELKKSLKEGINPFAEVDASFGDPDDPIF